MSRIQVWPLGLGLLGLSACATPVKLVHDAAILPLRSVRLYETGIGYFERAGTLGSRSTVLPVPAGHIDDALKTMVVLSRDQKTRVHGLEFASSVSPGMGRALAGLTPSVDDPIDFQSLLRTCKGTCASNSISKITFVFGAMGLVRFTSRIVSWYLNGCATPFIFREMIFW